MAKTRGIRGVAEACVRRFCGVGGLEAGQGLDPSAATFSSPLELLDRPIHRERAKTATTPALHARVGTNKYAVFCCNLLASLSSPQVQLFLCLFA